MRSDRRRPGDEGMATAELAACLPVLVLLLAVALTAVAVASGRVRVQDAAREAARAAARGDTAVATRLARQAAPGAVLSIRRAGTDVVAEVHAQVRPIGGLLPAFTVTGAAVAALEPAASGASP
ncbi:TadE-like protein [Jatrophihabitans endophyticus]|uniref:TadE-like protein n=1 Tax=Jatrophihabitans endophyticus TaxID=1206085 RepID=A0A1M5H1L9_9ACTN|nr:TadE family type IV pilus minor pilin [Jatrophihabitans endophyticus]SHG09815.1 TadE-like protein [Jatrophihabitans endophyticus]